MKECHISQRFWFKICFKLRGSHPLFYMVMMRDPPNVVDIHNWPHAPSVSLRCVSTCLSMSCRYTLCFLRVSMVTSNSEHLSSRMPCSDWTVTRQACSCCSNNLKKRRWLWWWGKDNRLWLVSLASHHLSLCKFLTSVIRANAFFWTAATQIVIVSFIIDMWFHDDSVSSDITCSDCASSSVCRHLEETEALSGTSLAEEAQWLMPETANCVEGSAGGGALTNQHVTSKQLFPQSPKWFIYTRITCSESLLASSTLRSDS